MSVSELARLEEEVEGTPTTQRLILVNGPPRSGKDTVGSLLAEFFPGRVYITKMAKALKERTHAFYGLFETGTNQPLAHDFFEDAKDAPSSWFMGKTPREAYIAVSERLVKPFHGDQVWGDLLVEDIRLHGQDADLVVVTDSGFGAEAMPLLRAFGNSPTRLFRMYRNGTDFGNDSRGYISLPGIQTEDIYNNDTPFYLAEILAQLLDFKINFKVEVQLPCGPFALNWFEQGKARPSFEQALAAVEALRQGGYGTRAIRVVAGHNTVVKMVMPGDAPTTELN